VTTTDRPAFAELMLGIGEAYGEAVSSARMEIYFAALGDLSLDAIRQAATVHVRTQKFFPRVAELREAIEGSADERADLAWVQLLRLVRRVGYMETPTWEDPTMARAACDLYGGWRALCERLPGEGPELLGVAKVFKATYTAYARRELRTIPALESTQAIRNRLSDLGEALADRGLPAPGLSDWEGRR
jgi:hypothetical protein